MSDTNNVWNPASAEATATIKFGKGYDDPWLVLRGEDEDVKARIITAFGLDPEESAELNLAELIVNATKQAGAMRAASAGLGGQVIKQAGGGNWSRAAQGADAVNVNVAPAEPERDPLFAKVEEQTSRTDLKELYARNKATFDGNAELLAAYKAKGKSLPAA